MRPGLLPYVMCHRLPSIQRQGVFSLTILTHCFDTGHFLEICTGSRIRRQFQMQWVCSKLASSTIAALKEWKIHSWYFGGTASQRFTPLLELAAILNLEATANKLLNFSRVVTWHNEWRSNPSPKTACGPTAPSKWSKHLQVALGSECLEKWRYHRAQRCDSNWKNGSRHR